MNTKNHKPYKNADSSTLCSKCSNACGKCTWSAFGAPVDGWTAIKTVLNTQHNRDPQQIDTFKVIECPKYIPDVERHTPDFRSDKTITLIHAILLQAVRDYASYIVKRNNGKMTQFLMQNIDEAERFFKSPFAGDMLHVCGLDMEPQLIIDAIAADPLGVIERLRINYGLDDPNEPDEQKRRGRPRKNCWDDPKFQINKAERKNHRWL